VTLRHNKVGVTASLLVPCEDDAGYHASISTNSTPALAADANGTAASTNQTQAQTETPTLSAAESRALHSRPLRFQPVRTLLLLSLFFRPVC
jgi:hypothetical protein